MNLIYFCIFNNSKYLDLGKLLLISIMKYSNIHNTDTKVLIYTNSEFRNIILNWEEELVNYYKDILFFEISNNKNSVADGCYARLEIFDLITVKALNPEKILYIDTDVLIIRNIEKVFEKIVEDKIYAKKEGSLHWRVEFWGKSLFQDKLNEILEEDPSCFCSGVMGFTNTKKIEQLFSTIKNHIHTNGQTFLLMDQPYIVYNTKINRLLENNTLEKYIQHNDFVDDNKDATIIHFCGNENYNLGQCTNKYELMINFMKTIESRL